MATPLNCEQAGFSPVNCCGTCRDRGDGVAVWLRMPLKGDVEGELCCKHAGGFRLRPDHEEPPSVPTKVVAIAVLNTGGTADVAIPVPSVTALIQRAYNS